MTRWYVDNWSPNIKKKKINKKSALNNFHPFFVEAKLRNISWMDLGVRWTLPVLCPSQAGGRQWWQRGKWYQIVSDKRQCFPLRPYLICKTKINAKQIQRFGKMDFRLLRCLRKLKRIFVFTFFVFFFFFFLKSVVNLLLCAAPYLGSYQLTLLCSAKVWFCSFLERGGSLLLLHAADFFDFIRSLTRWDVKQLMQGCSWTWEFINH